VAFKNPTADLPKSSDEAEASNDNKNKVGSQKKDVRPSASTGLSTKQLRQQSRAAEWRSQEDEAAERPGSGKVYLDPAEKKRIAFIKGEFHEGADAVHAYVVFAHPAPNRSLNVPPIFDPYEAAKLAAKKCDGVVYMERTLRVDHVGSTAAGVSKRGGTGHLDPRRSIFVGNLDFQSKEEDIRAYFEALLTTERGPPGEDDEGDEGESSADPVASTKTWVVHVRLVRDQDTQLGKGFAYIEFAVSPSRARFQFELPLHVQVW
jgi:nucleolar protein 12